jgi:UDP-N-acetylmuramoylalanine--D-glutamate ligase
MLASHGEVIGVDSGQPADLPEGFEIHLGEDGIELLDRVQTVVKSPGVPNEAPVVQAARARGIEVTGELELAWRLLPDSEFVAVTGTNGKTTTVELLGAIVAEAEVAGNVGRPLSALVGNDPPPAVIVCEASSFQLEDSSQFAPDTAVLLNLAEDHLDRHGTFDAYRDAKLRVFANQTDDHVAVLPYGFEPPEPVPGGARRVTFGAGAGPDLALEGDRLTWRGEPLIAADEIRLRGAHNLENAMAAAAAALARGISREAVVEALTTFTGVPHRLEEVAERDGVLYVNDSKATNVDAARVGIEAFEQGVHVILGGSLKGGGFTGLRDAVASRAAAVYLIGEAAERIAGDLTGAGVALHTAGDLATAVAQARANARPGDTVLLSPACASYDQYRDYEQRGQHFRELARG